jgi:hypothetical protein
MSDQPSTTPPVWTCETSYQQPRAGVRYTVQARDGSYLAPGDETTDFRGDRARIMFVQRGPEYNGTARVTAQRPDGLYRDSRYATVFDLTVTPWEADQ